jgi:hypothetical protein
VRATLTARAITPIVGATPVSPRASRAERPPTARAACATTACVHRNAVPPRRAAKPCNAMRRPAVSLRAVRATPIAHRTVPAPWASATGERARPTRCARALASMASATHRSGPASPMSKRHS